MYKIERQNLILEYLNKYEKVSVKELSEALDTSVVTIRADINELDEKGFLIKVHGGAVVNDQRINSVIPSDIKFQTNTKEKHLVGKIASRYVQNNDVIIIDSGSTTLEFAKAIESDNLTVFTNDLQIAMILGQKKNVNLFLSGGELVKRVYTLVGYETEDFFKRICVEKLFIGCDAIDISFGISSRTRAEVPIKKAMMEAADEVILITDHSKLNKKVAIHVTDIKKIDKLIIDKISEEDRKNYQRQGIEVITE